MNEQERDQLAQWHSLFSTSDIKKATEAYESLHRQLAAKDELHAAALQVLERHHQKQLAVTLGALEKVSRHCDGLVAKEWADAALAKIKEGKP